MTTPLTMSARRARIAALLEAHHVRSQDDLGRLLADEGFVVTQATLSRDLDAIGATKSEGDDGVRYVVARRRVADPLSGESDDQALARAVRELLLKAEAAGNIAVLHTPAGAAQYLAGHVDRSTRFDTVGSVAGDDTIILVLRTHADAENLCQSMLDLAEGGARDR